MMNYTTRKEIITSIVNSIDFSKHTFNCSNDVKFAANGIDISAFPCADISVMDKAISGIAEHMNGVKEAVEKSRLGESNKSKALELVSRVNNRIDASKNNTDEDIALNKWYCIEGSVRELAGLLKYVPLSVKDQVNRAYRLANSCRKDVGNVMEERSRIIRELEEAIIEACEEYRIEEWEKELEGKELTLDIIHAKDDESPDIFSTYRDAVCSIAFNRFGTGCRLIRAIYYSTKNGIPTMDWVSDYEVESIVKCANTIGIKEFAFEGSSFGVLGCLCEFSALGATFRFETDSRKDSFGHDNKYLRAVVVLP